MNDDVDDGSDALDLRPLWRKQYPSSGPEWDKMIDAGIDPTHLLHNLSLTPEQRILQLDEMLRFYEQVHGKALPDEPDRACVDRHHRDP